mmetsp:Transcript_49945/g.132787  ORF Transcript_49945/g.132787 Transcript_49945/m.132787 type:complete len:200 (-) Transcript_49945:1130-1729(-)
MRRSESMEALCLVAWVRWRWPAAWTRTKSRRKARVSPGPCLAPRGLTCAAACPRLRQAHPTKILTACGSGWRSSGERASIRNSRFSKRCRQTPDQSRRGVRRAVWGAIRAYARSRHFTPWLAEDTCHVGHPAIRRPRVVVPRAHGRQRPLLRFHKGCLVCRTRWAPSRSWRRTWWWRSDGWTHLLSASTKKRSTCIWQS